MVKIAIAGGAGNVAPEIIDALLATNKHEILVLTRRDPSTIPNTNPGITYVKTNYQDVGELAGIFTGVHTVLSFVAAFDREEGVRTQRNIIDASLKAGVRRFAPSEWVSRGLEHMPWYDFKKDARTYLAEINEKEKVLEYCLFQPGMFTNYLTRPFKSAEHLHAIEMPFDFEKRRMLLPEGGEDDAIVFTTVQDLANVVVRAIDYEGAWPVVGGIQGSRVTMKQFVALAEKLRGPVKVDKFSPKELADGTWAPNWLPTLDHPSIPPEHAVGVSKAMVAGILLAAKDGLFDVSDEWNKLLPEYEFEGAEGFLKGVWEGKP